MRRQTLICDICKTEQKPEAWKYSYTDPDWFAIDAADPLRWTLLRISTPRDAQSINGVHLCSVDCLLAKLQEFWEPQKR